MIVVPHRKALVLKLRNTGRVTTVLPTAKVLEDYEDGNCVAVPFRLDEVRVLRNIGIEAPSPINYFYSWPGRFKPFDAQRHTAEFLTLHRNAFVLNDLGTGKTLSTLWAYDYLRSIGEIHKALVVTPLSTLERTWADEIFHHFNHLEFAVLHGTRDKRLKLLDTERDLYLINHDGIKTNGFLEAMAVREDIDLIIVDEIAQVARNAGADRWKVLNKLVNKQVPRRVWGLTGTPTPNAPTDAWAQVRLVNPTNVPNYFGRFKDQVMRQVGPFQWVPRDTAVQIVQQAMQPAVRYSREDCVDLPPVVYQTREVPLTPEQDKAYKEMVRHLRTEVEEGEVLAVNEAVKIAKLLQIACGVAYGPNGEEITFPDNNRLAVLEEIIEEAGTKVIVFCPFVSALKHVADHLRKNFSVEIIHGGVGKNERDRIFSFFQKTADPKVLVAQPAAMSHGLTLTAASTIVWYSAVTSNEIYEQACGRITRPGQKHTQFIVNIEGSPVERRLFERLRTKQAMQGLLLDLVRGAQPVS